MKSPEEMEKALQRLMPAALSDRAHNNISQMLAGLAADAETTAAIVPTAPPRKLRWSIAAAAAIAIASALAWMNPTDTAQSATTLASTDLTKNQVTSPVLIDRMLVTNDAGLDGVITAHDGTVMHQVNRQVITRERYRTEKKGYLITISEYRAEKVLVPKNRF